MALIVLSGGCATLPSSGPTGAGIEKAARSPDSGLPFRIVELSDFSALPVETPARMEALADRVAPPTDLIGPGDVLDISIYEAGVALFGGGSVAAAAAAEPSAQVERLPPFRVDDRGYVRVPFAGAVRAAGRTTTELEGEIRTSLRGMSENPQVLVTIREAVTNSIILGGEVGRPGRLVLPTNRETLSDVIALAGGNRGETKDMVVRVLRGTQHVDLRLSDILTGTSGDFRIYPGDRVTIMRQPLSFSVMGAPTRAQQVAFPASVVSLAEAVALAGGSDSNLGDPKAIFVFRFVDGPDGKEQPVVYHLNMMKAGAYFLSQRFTMHDKDLLYIGNARANQPAKLIQIISQLFTPVVLARQLTQ